MSSVEYIVTPTEHDYRITLKTNITLEIVEPFMILAIYDELVEHRDRLLRTVTPFISVKEAVCSVIKFIEMYETLYRSDFPDTAFISRPAIPYFSPKKTEYPLDVGSYIYNKCKQICSCQFPFCTISSINVKSAVSLVAKLMKHIEDIGRGNDGEFSPAILEAQFNGYIKGSIRARITDQHLVDEMVSVLPEMNNVNGKIRDLNEAKKIIIAEVKHRARCKSHSPKNVSSVEKMLSDL